jgi:hypothetical protein
LPRYCRRTGQTVHLRRCQAAEHLVRSFGKRSVVYTFAPTYVTVMLFGHEQATIVQAAVA